MANVLILAVGYVERSLDHMQIVLPCLILSTMCLKGCKNYMRTDGVERILLRWDSAVSSTNSRELANSIGTVSVRSRFWVLCV